MRVFDIPYIHAADAVQEVLYAEHQCNLGQDFPGSKARSGIAKAEHRDGQCAMVVKYEVFPESTHLRGRPRDWHNEVALWQNLLAQYPSERTAKLIDCFEIRFASIGPEKIWVALYEYCDGGDLLTWKEQNQCFKEFEAYKKCARQMHEAVLYLHEKYIAHCDISMENIVIRLVRGSFGDVVLVDFGTACTCRSPVAGVYHEPLGLICRVKPYYIAPEMYWNYRLRSPIPGQSPPAMAADMWALGTTEYMLVTKNVPWTPGAGGSKPYLIDFDSYKALLSGGVTALMQYHNEQELLGDGHADHLSGMLMPDPVQRFSCAAALASIPTRAAGVRP